MAYTRTITQLISDVRIRADVVSAIARHPDAEIQRFLVESLQALRNLLTDAGSARFVSRVSVDIDYMSSAIPGAIGLQLCDSASAGANASLVDSVRTVRYYDGSRYRELRRVSLDELLDYASLIGPTQPEVWCDTGVPTMAQPSVSGFAPAVRMVYMAPWAGGYSAGAISTAPIVLGVYGIESLGASDEVCLEAYGYEWLIADAALKVATRDNDAQERAQLLMAARADAEKRMLATISREKAPTVQRRQVPAARLYDRRRWD